MDTILSRDQPLVNQAKEINVRKANGSWNSSTRNPDTNCLQGYTLQALIAVLDHSFQIPVKQMSIKMKN